MKVCIKLKVLYYNLKKGSTFSWTTWPIKFLRWIRFLWWFCSIFLRFWTSHADILPEKIFVSCKFPHKKFFWPFQKMSILKYIFWNSCFWTKPEKLCKPYKFFARQKCFYGPSIKMKFIVIEFELEHFSWKGILVHRFYSIINGKVEKI